MGGSGALGGSGLLLAQLTACGRKHTVRESGCLLGSAHACILGSNQSLALQGWGRTFKSLLVLLRLLLHGRGW